MMQTGTTNLRGKTPNGMKRISFYIFLVTNEQSCELLLRFWRGMDCFMVVTTQKSYAGNIGYHGCKRHHLRRNFLLSIIQHGLTGSNDKKNSRQRKLKVKQTANQSTS
jgi:hypothetical protein